MFEAAGWETITVKYGRRLRELFERPGGESLRDRIDSMSNEEYQRLLRSPAAELRERLPGEGRGRRDIERLAADLDDARDHGGDLRSRRTRPRRPARRVRARRLGARPPGGDLRVHDQGARPADAGASGQPLGAHDGRAVGSSSPASWAPTSTTRGPPSPTGSAEAELCRRAAERLQREPLPQAEPRRVPRDLGRVHTSQRVDPAGLRALRRRPHARRRPSVAERVVTVSPDVASSTSLGGWINHVGVWNMGDRIDWFADDADTLVRWRESSHGQHIELGIAEGNLVGLLGELGATWSRTGQPLLPIGTLYDPFVNRALEPWSFGIYAGGQSILVGTPSGVTLAPEGGAHQSIITPSVGLEQPRCVAWEPAFGQDLEWTMLAALAGLGHRDGTSAYFRLSTRPIDQDAGRSAGRRGGARGAPPAGARRRLRPARARRSAPTSRSSAWAP